MKYYPIHNSRYAIVNGTTVKVPAGINFITINMDDEMQGWSHCPKLHEGYWVSSISRPTLMGKVELDEDDSWTKVFEVMG